MLKVSFLGNCQLENIGAVARTLSEQQELGFHVVWSKPIYLLSNQDYIALMLTLESSDIIYAQYHDVQWGLYATENLRKWFDLRIVPTLESFASVPQTGEWEVKHPPGCPDLTALSVNFIDFRMLDLYLQNVPAEAVAEHYFSISARPGAIENEIARMVNKYRDYYTSGKVIFDYSEVYKQAMQDNITCYYTHNHPNDTQLEWLLNEILGNIGLPGKVTLNGPEMINQFQMPSLIMPSVQDRVIQGHPFSFEVATKIYYTYFGALDKEVLSAGLRASKYYELMDVQ